jgi:butyrate kinase
MAASFRILVVNPGSTSTKIALFEDRQQMLASTISHDPGQLQAYARIWDQEGFRLAAVREWAGANVRDSAAVVSVGGLLRPVPGGTYRVNERMLADARANLQGEHASNLGCVIAHVLASQYDCEAYVVDPVSVDELEPLARYSGHPAIERSSLSHALNIHAAARRAAEELHLRYAEASFIIAHLGGGISVAPVRGGRIVDTNDASSDGPFSPERTGGLPLQKFITLCYSGALSEREARRLVMGAGGLMAYLGTNSAQVVEQRINNGDARAREVFEAMAYQIAKEIGAMSTVLEGRYQAIVLTGGLAGSARLTGYIRQHVQFLAPICVYPGEEEMTSLALEVLRVLRGEAEALEY